ncbi:hypothetical protein O6H91_04G110000 [Diphasiastrum complanatum]|uniref:Uncharacterized protein n=1 Tax=Diphasiastrum complanatum TaxID=34168 RepID=A0ACC2E0L6_DIPCM|nr:hypothetical protein O6H91_04G110000 [Diphasiastrum complanatum]
MDPDNCRGGWESCVAAACLPQSSKLWCIKEGCFQTGAERCEHWTDIGSYVAALEFHKNPASKQQVLHSLASFLSCVVPILSSATFTADYAASALIGKTKVFFNRTDVKNLHVLLFRELAEIAQYLLPDYYCKADICSWAVINEIFQSQIEFICECLRCCIRVIPMIECFDTSISQSASETLDDIFQGICSPTNIFSLLGYSQALSAGANDSMKLLQMHLGNLESPLTMYHSGSFEAIDNLQTRVIIMILVLEVCMDELLLHPQFSSLLFKKKTNLNLSLSGDKSAELSIEAAFVHGLLSDFLKKSSQSIPCKVAYSTKLKLPACVLLLDKISANTVPKNFLTHVVSLVAAALGRASVSDLQLCPAAGIGLSWCSSSSASEKFDGCRCSEDLPSGIAFGLVCSLLETTVKLILAASKPILKDTRESLAMLPSTSNYHLLTGDSSRMILPFEPFLRYFEDSSNKVESWQSFITSLLHFLKCTLQITDEMMKVTALHERNILDVQAVANSSRSICDSGATAPIMYADSDQTITRHCQSMSTLLQGTIEHLTCVSHSVMQQARHQLMLPISFSILESMHNLLSPKCESYCTILYESPKMTMVEVRSMASEEHEVEPSNCSLEVQNDKSNLEEIKNACQDDEIKIPIDCLTSLEADEVSKDGGNEGDLIDKSTNRDKPATSCEEDIKQSRALSSTIVKRLLKTRHQALSQNATTKGPLSSKFESHLSPTSTKQTRTGLRSGLRSAARPLFRETESLQRDAAKNLCTDNPYVKEMLTIERKSAETFDDLNDFIVCKKGRNYSKFMNARWKYRRMLHSRTIWKRMQEKRQLVRLLQMPEMMRGNELFF